MWSSPSRLITLLPKSYGLHTIQKVCEGWDRAGGLTGMFDFLADSSRRAAAGGR